MFQLTELRGQIETCTSDIDLFDHVARVQALMASFHVEPTQNQRNTTICTVL